MGKGMTTPAPNNQVPVWFLMALAAAITLTWIIFALTIDHPGHSENFLTVTGVCGVVVTSLFGATYVKWKNGRGLK